MNNKLVRVVTMDGNIQTIEVQFKSYKMKGGWKNERPTPFYMTFLSKFQSWELVNTGLLY